MNIPLPEDEDSDDDFDGYIESDEDDNGGDDDIGNMGGDGDDDGDANEDGNRSDGRISIGDIPEFLEHPGCTQDMTNKTPIDFFQLLFTDDILQAIVEQTNLFAQQYINSHQPLPQRSRVQQWDRSPHDLVELKKFLALTIIMGLINYPTVEDHWVTSWPFATTTFNTILSRDRFSLLMRFLHLNDSTGYIPKGEPGYDPIYKLRPFVDPLIANFQAAFRPGREVSIDEAMIGFKGRLWFIQYMPKKPTKWGMKAFVLADSVTGYTYNWRLYAGMMKYSV